jgi:hypothetical protein
MLLPPFVGSLNCPHCKRIPLDWSLGYYQGFTSNKQDCGCLWEGCVVPGCMKDRSTFTSFCGDCEDIPVCQGNVTMDIDDSLLQWQDTQQKTIISVLEDVLCPDLSLLIFEFLRYRGGLAHEFIIRIPYSPRNHWHLVHDDRAYKGKILDALAELEMFPCSPPLLEIVFSKDKSKRVASCGIFADLLAVAKYAQ